MADIDEDLLIAVALLVVKRRRRRRRKERATWVRPWLLRREEQGAFCNLIREFRSEDETEYKAFLRMEPHHFDYLLESTKPLLQKEDTVMRTSISAAERLAVTLRFLASGDTYSSLSYLYRISRQALGSIIPETCAAIYSALKPNYVKVPNTKAEWERIAEDFESLWQFPNCVGAMDGKHVALRAPKNSGSEFYNYKHFHSIVLLAIIDAHYRFVMFDVGVNGRNSDAGVYANSPLSDALDQNTLDIPPPRFLPDWHQATPHVVVGDEAFPLKPYLLKPYPGRGHTEEERVFNYRLSRARRVSENAFGIMVNRFAVLGNKIILSPETATTVTLACIALHNFLRTECDVRYAQRVERPKGSEWYSPLGCQGGNHSSRQARDVRGEFCDYFNSVGSVAWQWNQ